MSSHYRTTALIVCDLARKMVQILVVLAPFVLGGTSKKSVQQCEGSIGNKSTSYGKVLGMWVFRSLARTRRMERASVSAHFGVPGHAPGTIAVNVTWMEREFNACQTHRSMYPSIFNRFPVIQPVSSKVRHLKLIFYVGEIQIGLHRRIQRSWLWHVVSDGILHSSGRPSADAQGNPVGVYSSSSTIPATLDDAMHACWQDKNRPGRRDDERTGV